MKTLYLYTTLGCHLCEQAEAMLLPYAAVLDYQLELVEISDSEQLMARYGVRIPVIRWQGDEQELGWPFEQEQLQQFLTG